MAAWHGIHCHPHVLASQTLDEDEDADTAVSGVAAAVGTVDDDDA
jgi:hypothetical protein